MIKSFRHKGLERFFSTGTTRGIDAQQAAKLRRLLTALHMASASADLSQPNYRLHQLHGDRRGQWSMWVSGNWRLVFEFDGTDVIDVDLVDYH
jgi:proteic killer suppression protein